MHYVIYAIDNMTSAKDLREQYYPEHRSYLNTCIQNGLNLILSGPLVDSDDTSPIGSIFIIEVSDLQSAESFHKSDPFYIHGVYKTATISPFIRRR